MDSYDQYDILNSALAAANEYPSNILRSHSFEHDLVAYKEALQQQATRLFVSDSERSGLKLFESHDGYGQSALQLRSLRYLTRILRVV